MESRRIVLVPERDANGTSLRFRGEAGADYRRYTGTEREVLREFRARRNISSETFNFASDNFSDDAVVRDPDDGLLELALNAGVLYAPDGSPITRADGAYTCALNLEDKQNSVEVSLMLLDEEGVSALNGRFTMLTSRSVLHENRIYTINNMGRAWKNISVFWTLIKKSDLTSYLSLMFSQFPRLPLRYKTWQTRFARPITAQPALLFMDIDTYEYLHVRPIAHLPDFPPAFLENEEIVSAVRMDETEKVFSISEIVFPEPSDDLFRAALVKYARAHGGKETLKKQIYEENGRFIIAPDFAKEFFSGMIFELSSQFVLLQTKVLAGYKVSFSRPRLKLSLTTGIDFLSGTAEVTYEGIRYTFSEFMQEYKKESFITLADGTKSFPDKRTMDKLDKLLSVIKGNEVRLSFFDIPLLISEENVNLDGEAWERARPFFEGYNEIEKRPGDWGIENGVLRSYQLYGVRWLDYLCSHGMGGCLADEMGLGKTVQVISFLRTRAARGETGLCLILCPKSVVHNWSAELTKFAPALPYIIHYGHARDIEKLKLNKRFQIVLSTYGTLRSDIEDLVDIEFEYVILDESQNIKNLGTQTTAAAISLKSRHKIAMSGTPIENNLADLYSLFRFLNPSFFGTQKNFAQNYLSPIQENSDENAMRDLKARIYPFILRRIKREVLSELPAKTEEIAYIDLDDEQLSMYNARRQEYKQLLGGLIKKGELAKSSMFVFKALSELRRLASVPEAEGEYGGPSAKRRYLVESIVELVENGHKCLVFANFLAGVELVSTDLAERGIANITMTGATGNRHALVHSFQTDPEIKAFIMTLKTGGTGINLTAADYIFIMDPWWNIAAESQAIDRSHRIGQTNPVFCYRLIARDTIEERILELQGQKKDLAGVLLSDETQTMKKLSAEDIAFLVGGIDE